MPGLLSNQQITSGTLQPIPTGVLVNGRSGIIVDSQSGLYDQNVQIHTYDRDDGLLVLPVAGPLNADGSSPPPRVIRTHAPYGYRQVNFSSTKRGAAPVLPAMIDTPSGDKFLSAELTIATPTIGGNNAQRDFVAAGSYMFVQGCSSRLNPDGSTTDSPGVRGSTTDDVYQTGVRPYRTDLLWAVLGLLSIAGGIGNAFAGIGPAGFLAGAVGGTAASLQLATAAACTPQTITNNPFYKYLTDNFLGNFFSSNIVA